MTYEEAKRILHPDTTFEALAEIESYAGFNGKQAKLKAVDDACIVACEALEKQIPNKPYYTDDEELPRRICVCGAGLGFIGDMSYLPNVCPNCGQRLDWSEEE